MSSWLKAQASCPHSAACSVFLHPRFLVPQIHPHLLELQLNVILRLEAQLCLGADGNEQLTDPLMDAHPVGLLVVLVTAEDKNSPDGRTTSTHNLR